MCYHNSSQRRNDAGIQANGGKTLTDRERERERGGGEREREIESWT